MADKVVVQFQADVQQALNDLKKVRGEAKNIEQGFSGTSDKATKSLGNIGSGSNKLSGS